MRDPSIPVAHGIARSSGEPDPVRQDRIGGHFVPIAAFAVLIAARIVVPKRRRMRTAVLSVGIAAGLLGGISKLATI